MPEFFINNKTILLKIALIFVIIIREIILLGDLL